MLYAEVALGLPIAGPFDYLIPPELQKKIKAGVRVKIPFGSRRLIGYVVKLKTKSGIKNLKSITEVIDDSAVLDKNMLLLTRGLSDYYCCSWGEAIETALPEALRKGKEVQGVPLGNVPQGNVPEATLIHDLSGRARWDIYLDSIKGALDNGKSAIVLLPDINAVLAAKEKINLRFGFHPQVLYRKQPCELEEWQKIREGKSKIVIGTRSAVFAPLEKLGLIIIDEEQNSIYKQEQSPHYHAREIAFLRADIEKTKLILGSSHPSLETFYLAKKDKIKYMHTAPKKDFPEIKIIDIKRLPYADRKTAVILSKYLKDSIVPVLNSGGKILLFLNQKGFATFASCRGCGIVLKCPRCNINLVYHFSGNLLNCHYCNFKMPAPRICPNCNSNYIRYSGTGTEKLESELARLFPQARIKRMDNQKGADIKDADIFISTKSIIGRGGYDFDLSAALAVDNSLNRIDLRSTEKTFALLAGLIGLTKGKLIIQTKLPGHYCFRALADKNIDMFYEEELKQRKQMGFPPYTHIALVKLRGKNEERVKELSGGLFEYLNKCNKNKKMKIVAFNPAQPAKLRGNFYWQVLIKSDSAVRISKFLKINLKNFSHSGIIVTVDIDPV